LHTALELSVLAAARGHPLHVHAEGLRGTGKTTIIRAAARLLPTILRVAGCPYNCDPARPHCPLHRDLAPAHVLRLGVEAVPAPFLEISPSAKVGTVVGSIDLGRLTDPAQPQAALLPGTLARAHRGVVFVDEINRLADTSPEIADALLDVMGTKPGRLQIEETGLAPVVLACRATVWAASNPDEEPGPLADIRRQLADRFDMAVAMRRPGDAAAVVAVLGGEEFAGESSLAAGGSAHSGAAPGEAIAAAAAPAPGSAPPAAATRPEPTSRLRQELQARALQPAPPMPAALAELLARAYCEFQVESLRAVQAWQLAARLLALRTGQAQVDFEHCRRVAPLVLRHRLEPDELARLLDQWEAAPGASAVALAAAAPVEPALGRAETSAAAAGEARGEARGEALPPAAAPAGRGAWWHRLVPQRGAPSACAAPAPDAARLSNPAALPPIAPRQTARFLTDLPPPELVMPARPGRERR
jgi:magnesium chelatase subunit I